MHSKYYLSLFIICSLSGYTVFAQTDIPVNMFTGKAQVSLPLWHVRNNTTSMPISLVSNGGGIKVTDNEGNAGMGWNVVAGGQLTREVRGLPDDVANGWLAGTTGQQVQNFSPSANTVLTNCADETSDYNAVWGMASKDTEPDLFSFNAPGLSGQFVFDHLQTIRLIPYQDIKIDYTRDAQNLLSSFTLTTNQGTQYQFTLALTTTKKTEGGGVPGIFYSEFQKYQQGITYNYAWMLKKITDPNGGAIDLTYSSVVTASLSKKVRAVLNAPVAQEFYTVNDEMQVVNVVQIKDDTHTVNFAWSFYGVIESISVSNTKSFRFKYQRIRNVNDLPIASASGTAESTRTLIGTDGKEYETEEPHYRSFLMELKEQGTDCTSFPAYRFSYYDVDWVSNTTHLPFKNKFARDLWGFYNGNADVIGSLTPKLYVNSSIPGQKGIRIKPHPTDGAFAATNGTDRSVNTSTVYYGSLKTITYPSGGSAEITYEAADYYDSLVSTTYSGGGVRVKEVRIDDGDNDHTNDIIKQYEYKRADGHSSGKFIYPPVFGFYTQPTPGVVRSVDNLAPDEGVVYSTATVKQNGKGRIVFDYSVPGTWQQTQVRDWGAPFSRIARQEYTDYETQCPTVYPPPYTITTYETQCTWNPELVRDECIVVPVPVTITPEPYIDYQNCTQVPAGNVCPNAGLMTNEFNGYPFVPSTNFDFERGLPQVVSSYDEANRLVQKKTYTYQRLATAPVIINAIAIERSSSLINYSRYNLLTNVSKVIAHESTQTFDVDNNSGSLQTAADYVYSPTHFLLSSVEATNSKNEITKTRFKYAKDFSVTSSSDPATQAIASLNSNYRHGTSLETITSLVKPGEEKILSAQLTLFKNFAVGGGKVLPSENLIYTGGAGFAESYINGSNVLAYSGYRSNGIIEEYNALGQTLTVQDYRKHLASIIYKDQTSLPKATLKDARWNEVVINTVSDIQSADYSSYVTDAYSGEFSYHFTSAGTIRTTGIKKNIDNRYYRFVCRVRMSAPVNFTVNVLDNATQVLKSSATVTYPSSMANQWSYLETTVDMNAAGNLFTLQVQAPAGIDFDYLAFYPQQAEITTQVIHPVMGILSQTDTRGTTVFNEYDQAGRLKYVKDKDKNVVQVNEYQYKVKPNSVIAAFHTSGFNLNAPVTFTSYGNCVTTASYQWYVNGTAVAGANQTTFSYTFTADEPEVKLEVSHPEYGFDSYSQKLKAATPVYVPTPLPAGCDATISISTTESTTMMYCENGQNPIRHFSAGLSNLSNCTQTPYIIWQYRLTGSSNDFVDYQPASGTTSLTFNFTEIYVVPQAYQVRAGVQQSNGSWNYSSPITMNYNATNTKCD